MNFNLPSGNQLVINGTLNTGSNITILSGAILIANSGSQLNFSNGKSILINGTLSANGSSGSLITFDFTSPSSTYQNGIKFNSGSSGTLSYCNIKNAYQGVKCYSSLPTIQYCNIFNNGTGIYIYSAGSRSSLICNNNNIYIIVTRLMVFSYIIQLLLIYIITLSQIMASAESTVPVMGNPIYGKTLSVIMVRLGYIVLSIVQLFLVTVIVIPDII